MSNLKLVSDEPTPLEKMLLDASRAEQPSAEHKARLRAALGIGVPLSAPPPAIGAGASGAPAAAAPSATPAAAAGSSSLALKLGSGAALFALAGALLLARQEPAPPPRAVTPMAPLAQQVEPPAFTPPPERVEPADEPEPAVSPLPAPEARPAAPRAARSESSAPAAEDLTEQIRLIEAARAGVASRDPRRALESLDRYRSRYPRGSFGQEATVLRIRALDQSGDSARASTMARSFIARFPSSPHVARLKPIAERGASR